LAKAALEAAFEAGITFYDTAYGYGDSEKILGEVFRKCCRQRSPAIASGPAGTAAAAPVYPWLGLSLGPAGKGLPL